MRTTSKKLIGFIAAAAMTVSLLPANIAFAEDYTWENAANDAHSGTDYIVENGTYTVSSAKGLAYVAKVVNDGDTDINITLADNIDLSTAGVTGYDVDNVTSDNSWIPIGNGSYKYNGTFDGAGKTISNLYINTSNSYVGLFGYVNKEGKVINTTVESGDVKSNVSTSYVAGIAGRSEGEISKCYNGSNVRGNNAGGIVGKGFESSIFNSTNTGNITGNQAGGIIGYNDQNSIIDSCINFGIITNADDTTSSVDNVGGIAGNSVDGDIYGSTVKNCINMGDISNTQYFAGGIVGACSYTNIVNCANVGSISGYLAGGIVGWNISKSTSVNNVNIGVIDGLMAGGIAVSNSAEVLKCYSLEGCASSLLGSGNATECYTFSEINGEYIVNDDEKAKLIDKLNEYVTDNTEYELTSWSSNNGGLQLGDCTVIEPTEPEPSPDTEVTTSAIAVAEDTTAETTLKENNINTADGIYGGNTYGNTISTTFRTTQAIADAGYDYGVWTVDLTQGDAYVKSSTGTTSEAIVTDSETVKNNNGAIYAMDSSNAGKYKLYFNKNTYLSGSGGVVFGLVIDGLYAPKAAGAFEFTNVAPTDGTELNESNSIFTGAGDDYVHDDNVLHQSSAE